MPRDKRSRRDSSSDSERSVRRHERRRSKDSSGSKRRRSRDSADSRRRRRDRSRDRKPRKSTSRSPSRYYQSRKRSLSKERSSKKYASRSRSRSMSDSRSRSRERSDYSKTKHKSSKSRYRTKRNRGSKKRSSSGSESSPERGESRYESTKKYIIDDTESKIEKAIKAAEAVGLTMCKLPSYEQKEVEVREEMPTIQDRNVLDELNSDSFVPKQFSSSRSKKIPENIVIDLDAGTVKVPDVELPQVDSLFHPDLFPDEKLRMEKWVKKMFQFRQKALRGEI